MDTLKLYTINKRNYYLADDLINLNINILHGCKNGRRIIDEKSLTTNDYTFAKYINKKWISSNGSSYKYDKVFIRKKWLDNKLIQDGDDEDDEEELEEEIEDEILMAPGIITLKKSEKMKDNKGNILEIEIRGTREHDNCFFRVSDVAKGFGMNKLYESLMHKNSAYQNTIHYRYFYFSKNPVINGKSKKVDIIHKNKNKKVKSKKIFLTYTGLLKVLFSSRNNSVNKFVGWAVETLFTAHLGTKEKKDILASKLMGISTDVVKEVFSKTSSTLPTLYLLSIGKVKDLRVALNIGKEYDDEMIVCKGGETEDLTRRIDEHNVTYGKMAGANLCLKWYNYIDPQFTSKAETELFHKFGLMNYKLSHPKYDELIIFAKKDMKNILNEYDTVALRYTGHIKEVKDKIKDLENHMIILKKDNENDLLRKENELMAKQNELIAKDRQIDVLKKELELKDRELEIMKKDLEITNLKKRIRNK